MELQIPAPAGPVKGYLAQPQRQGDGPWPGVVVIHDLAGMSADTRRITDRFAESGYLAVAPNLYSRGGFTRCVKTVFRDLTAARGRSFEDIDATRTLLADRDDCTGKVGVVGFCMGGGFALVAATRDFDASAPYYGELPKDLSILDGACPIVASFGRRDPILKGAAAKLESELTARDIPHDVKEYPDAGHSFANKFPLGPFNVLLKVVGFHYHHESSEDSWRRVLGFFQDHLR
ncbi:dienelactone hydrolase family protein [Amycolatopsis anabasis]|uniref:dienelactone hydrolase family protein n=1 Tax=Amycolatopsis anabasis TaxID=1840409 RepID=UPI00131E2218|nr:dienelactone hydrolase family protein [Amycolatopsis anabasis]